MDELKKLEESLKQEREAIENEYNRIVNQISELENRKKLLRDRAIYIEGALDALRKMFELNAKEQEGS